MKPKRGLRKLVDVWGSQEATKRLHDVLQNFLDAHLIDYELHNSSDPYGRQFWRYKVDARDLSCAQGFERWSFCWRPWGLWTW